LQLSKILPSLSSLNILIIGFVVVAIQVLDTNAAGNWTLYESDRNSFHYTMIYYIVSVISIAIHILFLIISTRIAFGVKKAISNLSILIKYLYLLSHIAIIASIIYLLLEQILTSSYHIVLLELIIGLSLIPSVFILFSLGFRGLKSISSTKSKIVIIYSIALITIAAKLFIAFGPIELVLDVKPKIITVDRNPWTVHFYTPFTTILSWIYAITDAISFIAVWIGSILLTKQYVGKIGKIKYCIIVSIPVIYFLLQYSPLLLAQTGTLSFLLMEEGSIFLNFYNFVLNTGNVGTGVLFGISFFILSRSLKHEQLRYYLIISGIGIMIIFSSGLSPNSSLAPFPAWSITSLSFILPASFLLMIGLDSATYYIATDTLLRRFLHKHKDKFELIRALGFKKTSDIAEQKIHEIIDKEFNPVEIETIFKPLSESEDIKQYINKVLRETKKSNKKLDDDIK
jgi:hypothetical protein